MPVVRSRDGTEIVFDRSGSGPALVLVDGALSTRSSGTKPELHRLLSEHCDVVSYDRRGRGASGDTPPYRSEREIEDLAALVEALGGPVHLYGHSSGAALAFNAALALGDRVAKLAMYEAPYDDDAAARDSWRTYLAELGGALAEGRHGDAVALFLAYVDTPAEQIDAMRAAPFWPAMERLGPSLAHDAGVIGPDRAVPVERARSLGIPSLVMHGGRGAPFMRETARHLVSALPRARLATVPGEGHNVSPTALVPILVDFLREEG